MSQRALKRRAAGRAEPDSRQGALARDFLRMVSHELRTPLNSILGFSDILQTELYGPLGAPEYKEYAEIIHASGKRLLRLVNQALELAKIEAGGEALEPAAEALDQVFEDAARAVADEFAIRRLRLRRELPEHVPAALADARAIRTAVVNLLQNAAAFAPENGEVRLSGRVQGALVQIEIADDGEGMDAERAERLLQAVRQGEEAGLARRDGTGFGWAIVHALCKGSGARFEVTTAPGEGMRAVLSFRRAR
jgi:signal transduction histidine kinase